MRKDPSINYRVERGKTSKRDVVATSKISKQVGLNIENQVTGVFKNREVIK